MKVGRKVKRVFSKPREASELAKGSMFLVTVVLCLGLIIMSVGIRNHFVRELEINARNLAMGYTHSLQRAVEASNIVRELINEKLLHAAGTIADLNGVVTNENLREMGDRIDVEEIHIYSHIGEILYSNISSYLGWAAPPGHPVQRFITSGLDFHVDPLRENTITGQLMLYGYERLEDGRVVQVGIDAKTLEGLIQGFELDRMFEDMTNDNDVAYVTYVDAMRHVLGSSQGVPLGSYLPEKEEEKNLLEALSIGEFQLIPQEDIYEVEEPVLMDGTLSGTLVIGLALENTRVAIRGLNRVLTVVMVMIYLAAIGMLYLLHHKNARLHRMAYVDELTMLPNLRFFRKELNYQLSGGKGDNAAVLLFQLPRFSKITMAKGHEQSERILKEMAEEFSRFEGDHLTFYRHSDEKFLALVHKVSGREEIISVMQNLSRLVPQTEGALKERRFSSLRFGVLELSGRYTSENQVLKDALIALNNARGEGALQYAFFDEPMEKSIHRESLLEAELKDILSGISPESLSLHYQPIIGNQGKSVVQAEALARMSSRHFDSVPPVEFIEVAEKNGLMGQLGQMILEKACDFVKKLEEDGQSLKVSVNLSGLQLLEDDFLERVQKVLETKGVPTEKLSFEITESVFLGNYEIVNCKLKALKDMGITLSMDDFGTGYSSFARLKELHVDGVKIDRYFIRRISALPEDKLITSDIIRMVHKYGLYTVAEGVESAEEMDYLWRESCDCIQGYYYSRPLPEQEFLAFVTAFGGGKDQ